MIESNNKHPFGNKALFKLTEPPLLRNPTTHREIVSPRKKDEREGERNQPRTIKINKKLVKATQK